jgi:hypothetical protein
VLINNYNTRPKGKLTAFAGVVQSGNFRRFDLFLEKFILLEKGVNKAIKYKY